MGLIYKWVCSEAEVITLLKKMKKSDGHLRWVESFAHAGDVTIERNMFVQVPGVGYREFFMLTMPHKDGQYCCTSDIRKKVYDEIRAAVAAGHIR